MKHINKLTLSALALPIAAVPAITTSCNKQQTITLEIDSKGLVTLKDKTLTKVKIPATIDDIKVQGIASNGFKNSKVESVTFEKPDQITYISDNAFEGCTSLKSFSIPKNVKYLGVAAFAGCTKLEQCTFADGIVLQTLKERTFEDNNMYDITIPSSIVTIEKKVFAANGPSRLTKVNFQTKVGWNHKGVAIPEADMQPDKCSKNFHEMSSTASENWGYTGIDRTVKKANINYSLINGTVFKSVTATTPEIDERDSYKTITFTAQAKQDQAKKYVIWVTTDKEYTVAQGEYDVGDSERTATTCYLTVDDWSYIKTGDTLFVRAMEK